MAALVLGAIGTGLGTAIGGGILGVSAAVIGGAIGSAVGSVVDSMIVASFAPNQRIDGTRLDSLKITSSTEGAVIQRVYGRARIGGNIIWATDYVEHTSTETQGGKGGGGKVTTETVTYTASIAIGLCEGIITGIGRIWADGKPLDMTGVQWRWYPGDEEQLQDPLILSEMGPDRTPAYRGTAYVVFENLNCTPFGNRVPQLTFEVFAPLADVDTAEGQIKAITIIPASGEFVYSTDVVKQKQGSGAGYAPKGTTVAFNAHVQGDKSDFSLSMDGLEAAAPALESASLVVSWYGSDLRAGNCLVKPKVEVSARQTTPNWQVNGVARGSAAVVSTHDSKLAFGGTPDDAGVVQAIDEIKLRGNAVTFYPFVMMDIPAANTLPTPYSDNAATLGQPQYPWRGRITCSPAAGYAGSVDKTAAAATQISAFFGAATPANFSVSGTAVSWTGGSDWGYRRMVLHYAHLCVAAGGVDAFIIGSELRGLTQARSNISTFPAVAQLISLAAAVRSIVGPSCKVGYAADWSEYFGFHPQDGSDDVFFNLDPLWADANIDFIGIDNYFPLSDWRDGFDHLDGQIYPTIYDRTYLMSNVAGGEGYDWFYASDLDRAMQIRTPITDGAYNKPWTFRYKDLLGWWSNQHFPRSAGVESASATAWVPESKPIWFTEIGCPAVDMATNQPNVFVDPKSSEALYPYCSRGFRDDAIQRAYIDAIFTYWNDGANNPTSGVYGEPMVDTANCYVWTWDARPYPAFPEQLGIWSDGENWRKGHWLTGRLGAVGIAALVKQLCLRAGYPAERINVDGLYGAVEGYVIASIESPRASIAMLARHFGFDAVESQGTLKFVMRGQIRTRTITVDDLIDTGDEKGENMELTHGDPSDMAQRLHWFVMRSDSDYETADVMSSEGRTDTARVSAENFPMIVPVEEAKRRVDRAYFEAWLGIEGLVTSLPPSQLALDPTDVIGLDHDERITDYRLTQIGDREGRTVEAVQQDRFAYNLPPGPERPTNQQAPAVIGEPQVILMNLPQLTDAALPYLPYVAITANPWPGSEVIYRSPTLDGYVPVLTVNRRAVVGLTDFPFYSGAVGRFDYANELYLTLALGTLTSVTDSALFAGANAFAIESSPGQWEVLQAATCTLIGPKQYKLTKLLRGQKGTEGKMGNPVAAGARVIALDFSVYPVPIVETDVSLPFNWRVGPASRAISDPSYIDLEFTPDGTGLKPYSPAMFNQPYMRARLAGDYVLEWNRRDRALVADAWDVGDVPMSETAESYEVEIMDGAAVKRLLTTATNSVNYTAAMQTTDWGAPIPGGTSIVIRIYQMSARVGRGTPLIKTLYF